MKYKRFYICGTISFLMLLINIFIYLILLLPARNQVLEKEDVRQRTRKDINQKILNIGQKLNQKVLYKKTMDDLSQFKALLLDQHEFSKIVDYLSVTAKKQKISIPSISYHQEKVEKEGLKKVSISFTVEGRYKDIKRFIYNLEDAKDFLILEDLGLARSGSGSDPIKLQIRIATYLR